MRTKDFKVLASTCKRNWEVTADADIGIELHCTAILDQQTLDYNFNYWYTRRPRYCIGWWDSASGYTCNTPYSAFASTRVSADKDGIHCTVARIYRDIYFDRHFPLYEIPINIIRKGKNNTAHAIHICAYCIDVVEAHSCVGLWTTISVYLDSYYSAPILKVPLWF